MELRNEKGQTEQDFLKEYRESDYERPSVTVDMPIFTIQDEEKENYRKLAEKKLKILLVQRKDHPFIQQWALPGGFVHRTETLEEAAARELKEETGVKEVYLEQLYTFSNPNRDPRTWVITCAYMALISQKHQKVTAGDDASKAEWFEINLMKTNEEYIVVDGIKKRQKTYQLVLIKKEIQLKAELMEEEYKYDTSTKTDYRIIKNEGLAFDHALIIFYAMKRLRGKLEYTDIALNLMPEYFTLTELQKVYEVIMDTDLLMANFRRKIANLVEETELSTENAGHRPSKLYKRKRSL